MKYTEELKEYQDLLTLDMSTIWDVTREEAFFEKACAEVLVIMANEIDSLQKQLEREWEDNPEKATIILKSISYSMFHFDGLITVKVEVETTRPGLRLQKNNSTSNSLAQIRGGYGNKVMINTIRDWQRPRTERQTLGSCYPFLTFKQIHPTLEEMVRKKGVREFEIDLPPVFYNQSYNKETIEKCLSYRAEDVYLDDKVDGFTLTDYTTYTELADKILGGD